jgi:hypothetical protein
MKPSWDKLGDEYAGSSSVLIADADCTAGADELCSQFGIRGYPTIKYFLDGDSEGQDYKGGRDFDSMKEFVFVFEWGEDNYMKTKFTVSGFEYFPPLDRNLFYCAIADHGNWFDTWPGMDNLPYMSTFEETTALERPLAMTFGDGEEMTREDFETFVKVYEDNGIPIHWNAGDIAVICNYRFAHGRLGFNLEDGEKRELGVILGEMFPRAQCKEGKW